MAAGAGRRMGYRPKALLRRNGQPLLLRQIHLLHRAGLRHVVVVLGHHASALQTLLAQAAPGFAHPVQQALNPAPDAGPGSSLRCGLAALPPDLAAVTVLLADQPLLDVADVATVLTAWQQRPSGIALLQPCYQGDMGHPLMFDALLRQHLMAQAPHAPGLRQWRKQHPAQTLLWPATHSRYTTDVDSPEALQALQAQGVMDVQQPLLLAHAKQEHPQAPQ